MTRLIDDVADICSALAPHGWRDLLLGASLGRLDIGSDRLDVELLQALPAIDASIPGFEDLAPVYSQRDRRLVYPAARVLLHAVACPRVQCLPDGRALEAFASLADQDAIENFVFSLAGVTLASLARWADDGPLAMAAFATDYRSAANTPSRQQAGFCHSRTGIARAGTAPAYYDESRREFAPLVDGDAHAMRVKPVRYVPYLAVQRTGAISAGRPARWQAGDEARSFWVPVHKLFDGCECIAGLDLDVSLQASHVNEKLARLFGYLNEQGYTTGVEDGVLGGAPFTVTEGLAAFDDAMHAGPGVLVPELLANRSLLEPAQFEGRAVTLHVAEGFEHANSHSERLAHYFSGLYIEPDAPLPAHDGDSDIVPSGQSHRAPEVINARHAILPTGEEVNFNDRPDVVGSVIRGGFDARLYRDLGGEGAITVRCPQLASEEGPTLPSVPAYSIIAAPDFFPYCDHVSLLESWQAAPDAIREGLWAVPPYALCDRRFPPNVHLPAFSGSDFPGAGYADTTATAIVALQAMGTHPAAGWQAPVLPAEARTTALPDGASGVFDPGWDITTDSSPTSGDGNDESLFLSAYGLGTPFVEDVKICAALGTYWPALAPDSTRTYSPYRYWPTVCPLTDAEIGQSGVLPWDGIRGPRWHRGDATAVSYIDYIDIEYVDYVDTCLAGAMSATLTSRIDNAEYERRVYAMAWTYWSLGIRFPDANDQHRDRFSRIQTFLLAKAEWAVYSFLKLSLRSDDLPSNGAAAVLHRLAGAGIVPTEDHLYRFVVYRWDAERVRTSPDDFQRKHVDVLEHRIVYVDARHVWMHAADDCLTNPDLDSENGYDNWQVETIPT